jgi:DNA-binding SARP family transcriptional activator
LRAGADTWLDAAEFERLCAEGDRLFGQEPEHALSCYRRAMALYGGDYLQDYPYEEWASEERERLLSLFLRVADRLAHGLAEKQRWQETIEVAEAILRRDDCWEQAYRLLMLAFAQLGNHSQAIRAYQRCTSRLRQELNINPSPSTVRLHQMLLAGTSR